MRGMGFFDRFRRAPSTPTPQTGKNAAISGAIMFRGGQPATIERSPAKLAREGYMQNADAYAAVNVITTAFKGLPWNLYRIGRSAKRAGWTRKSIQASIQRAAQIGVPGPNGFAYGIEARKAHVDGLVDAGVLIPVEAHPVMDLWNYPNPNQDGASFREALAAHYLISGNSYAHAVGPDAANEEQRRPPTELWTLRPDRMEIIVSKSDDHLIEKFRYGGTNGRDIHPSAVGHWKRFHPMDDFYGLSPLSPIAGAVDQSNRAEAWNSGLLKNGAVRPGAFTTEGNLTPDQRKDLKDWIDEDVSGPGNAMKPLLLEAGLKYHDMGLTPLEMQFIEGQRANRVKVCMAYGVAPELLGDATNKTYSNYGEARKALYQETVIPHATALANLVNQWLVSKFGDDLLLDFDVSGIDALSDERDKVWDQVGTANWLTVNEKRLATGRGEIPGGDVILVPLSSIPLAAAAGRTDPDGTDGDGATKAFNLETTEQKDAYWNLVEKQRDRLTDTAKRAIVAEFEADRRAVALALKDANEFSAVVAASKVIDARARDWKSTLSDLYVRIGVEFGKQTVEQIQKQTTGPSVRKGIEDQIQIAVREYIETYGGEKVKAITTTSKNAIRAEVAAGLEAGEGIDEIAKRVDTLYLDQIIPYRSEVIARTEVSAASGAGSRAGAEATGLPLEREWIATRDGRERDAHGKADGQRKAFDEPYQIGADELMFPSDGSKGASAGNVINCRCVEAYHVIRS